MKPFMKYPGGKAKELPLINKYKPKIISRYFEPFVGGGSVYFDLNINESYINDYSYDLINFYTQIKKCNKTFKQILMAFDEIWRLLDSRDPDNNTFKTLEGFRKDDYFVFYNQTKKRKTTTVAKLIKKGNYINKENLEKIEITIRKTAFYMMVRNIYNQDCQSKEMRAAAYYFLREYCYSSMFRFSKNGNFNVPYGGMSYDTKYLKNKIEEMFSDETRKYMKKTVIQNLDFEDFLKQYKYTKNDFVFLDPPYDSDFSTYDQNPFDKTEQMRLNCLLKHINANWMLIIKKTDFIKNLYKDFYIYEYEKNYMVSFKNRNDKEAEHLLITNYRIMEEKQ